MEWMRQRYFKLLAIKNTAKENMARLPDGSPKIKFYEKVINKVDFRLEAMRNKFGHNIIPVNDNIKQKVQITVLINFLRQ